MKDNKRINALLTGSFIIYIFGFLFLFIVIKDNDFSEIENRKLSSIPKFSFEDLLNRKFGDKFETYVADQFPFRNKFITIKSYSELIMQKKENNGVYVAKDGNFIEKFEEPDIELMKKLSEYINDFSQKYNTYMMIAPTSITINKDKLPSFVDGEIEERTIREFIDMLDDKIINIPLVESLKDKNDEYIYYKTDHHWTTLGAYYAYRELCNSMKIEPKELSDFNIEKVSDDFYGTLFSKGNFTFAQPDDINLFYPKEEIKLKVEYVFNEKTTDSLYEFKYLDEKDKYGVFLDNNHPLIKITTNSNSDRKIAILKDSYSHSLIPFLVNHFSEIHILDLRHFKSSVNEYLVSNDLNDVIFLYNARNIISDRNIMRLKR